MSIFLISVILTGVILVPSFADVSVPQKGTMQLNLEVTDPGGTDTVTDTVVLKNIKASEIEPFIRTRLSRYGAVQVNDALNMLIITDLEKKVVDLIKTSRTLDVAGLNGFLRLDTVIVPLKNIQASSISDLVKEKLSSDAVVKVNSDLNVLIITDVKSKIDEAQTLISQLDIPVRQVMIEAKIVELNSDSDSKYGTDWQNILQSAQASASYGEGNMDAGGNQRYQTAQASTMLTLQGLDSVLGILTKDGTAKILSSPRIVTSNNKLATIRSGDKVYYLNQYGNYSSDADSHTGISAYSSNSTNVDADNDSAMNVSKTTNENYVNADLSLCVTPHIVSEDLVTLDIHASVGDLVGWGPAGTPIISQRSANSTVTVKNGEVFVMGGLKKDSTVKSVEHVPVLGYIPIIGFFFSSEKERVISNDVVIFVTPTVLKDAVSKVAEGQ